jgi:isopentenyl-diphosphate delta-isomerase
VRCPFHLPRRLITDHLNTANSFTPWFKLIARDFLFGWWDELLNRKGVDGLLNAKNLAGIVDGSQVIRMT